MSGRISVTVECPACGRRGVVTDPQAVARLTRGRRPLRFRCDRRLGGCGLHVAGAAAQLLIAWDSDATPFRPPSGDPPG
jgi:hypothetical protein